MVGKDASLTGLLEQAYEQLKEAAYMFGRVCDSLHPEACHCLSLLAKMAYVQGHPAEVHICAVSQYVFQFEITTKKCNKLIFNNLH